MIRRRSLLLAGVAGPAAAASAYAECVTDTPAVDACRGGVRITQPPGVTLDLSFFGPTLDPRITFTRASTATYFDSSGVMQTAATNAPRFDYDPTTRVLRGLLVEEARTNLLLNSASLGTQSIAVTAQAYTLSFYGTGTITKSGAASGAALIGTGTFPQRVSQTFTPTAGTLTCTVTGSVLNAQLESGSFVTSWIPTTAATATRAVDTCQIPPANMGFWVAPGGSWFAEFISQTVSSGSPRIIGYPSAGVRAPLFVDAANHAGIYDGAALYMSVNTLTLNAISKVVTTWAPSVGRVCLNGAAVGSAALGTGFADMAAYGTGILSTGTASEQSTGYIRRVGYWPRILSNAEMQAVTT